MEALGVASGAAGILSLGIAVCQGLLQYYGSWKDAESDVAGMYESIEALARVLRLLLPALEHGKFDHNVVAVIEENITSCHQGIEKLRKKLDKIKISPLRPGWRRKAQAQLWRTLYPFKASTLVKLKGIGNELRDHLSLALNVLRIDASTASLTKLDVLDRHVADVTVDVDFLKQQSGLLSRNLNGLADSVENSSSGVDALILSRSSEYHLKVFRWFSPLAGVFERKQRDTFNLKARQDGIGKWLLKTKEFTNWLVGDGEILWCPGKRNVPVPIFLFSLSRIIASTRMEILRMLHLGVQLLGFREIEVSQTATDF